MPLSPQLLEEARRLREAGLNYAEIARRLGLARTTVYYALNPERRRAHAARWRAKAKGMEAPVEARRYKRLTEEDVRTILELGRRGETTSSIAKSLGRSTSLVYQVLKKHGVLKGT